MAPSPVVRVDSSSNLPRAVGGGLAVLALALVLAGCGGGGSSLGARAPGTGTARAGDAQLRQRLTSILGNAEQSGVEIYDLSTGKLIFAVRPTIARPPGSDEKLYTSVAALQRLGPGARFRTTLFGEGRLTPGDVWRGNLYLRGGGDPTLGDTVFNIRTTASRGATVEKLAGQIVRQTGIRRVTGRLFGDESLFGAERGSLVTGYRPDFAELHGELGALTYDHGEMAPIGRGRNGRRIYAGPGATTAIALARALRKAGVAVNASTSTAVTPRGARMLTFVESPPLSEILILMDGRSDVLYSEDLAEQLGERYGGQGSISAGARVIEQTLAARFGIRPHIVDGSGLSHLNRTSPEQLVQVLNGVARGPLALPVRLALPLAGVSGTLSRRMQRTAAFGRCWAKTGTVAAVSNLAGYCRAPGGDLLSFAIMIDGLPIETARAKQDAMLAELVRDDPH